MDAQRRCVWAQADSSLQLANREVLACAKLAGNLARGTVGREGRTVVAEITEVAGVGRQAFARLLAQRGYTFGVEVGVERGVHAKGLCQRIPGLTLYCIDPWRCVPGYREHVPQERLDSFYEETRKRLAPYTPYIWREASLDAVGFFKEY